MIRAIIVDDEPYAITALKNTLKEYNPEVVVIDIAWSVAEGLKLIHKYKNAFELLFLDIQMPGEDGFSLLQQLETIDFKVIFTTAFDHYAIKAIRYSALDYLLKPIDHLELKEAIDRMQNPETKTHQQHALLELKKNTQPQPPFNRIAIPSLSEILFITIDDILYIEGDRNYCNIHFNDGSKIISSKNTGYYEDLLSTKHFFRIHNSYLVNLGKIKKYIRGKSGSVQMENGITLDVSLRRKEDLLKLLNG